MSCINAACGLANTIVREFWLVEAITNNSVRDKRTSLCSRPGKPWISTKFSAKFSPGQETFHQVATIFLPLGPTNMQCCVFQLSGSVYVGLHNSTRVLIRRSYHEQQLSWQKRNTTVCDFWLVAFTHSSFHVHHLHEDKRQNWVIRKDASVTELVTFTHSGHRVCATNGVRSRVVIGGKTIVREFLVGTFTPSGHHACTTNRVWPCMAICKPIS